MVWTFHHYDVTMLGVVDPILSKQQFIQYHLLSLAVPQRCAWISSKVLSCPISLSIAGTTTARVVPFRAYTVNLVFACSMKGQACSTLLLWKLIVCLLESLKQFSRRWFGILVFFDGDYFQAGKVLEELLNIVRIGENGWPR